MPSVATDPRLDLVERFFRGTGSTYDFMVHAATFGIDRLWKRRMTQIIRDRIPHPRAILDLACGTGISTFALARAFPSARIVGVELREEYLQRARAKPECARYPRVEFALSRAETFETPERFDVVSASYLAKYADLAVLVGKANAWLAPGGLLVMHDFTFPPNPVVAAVWRAYFWGLQRLGSKMFPAWKEIYDGLPKLIVGTTWAPDLMALLRLAGFERVTFEWQTLGGAAIVTARGPAR